MAEKSNEEFPTPDLNEFSLNMSRVAAQSQRLVADFLERHQDQAPAAPGPADPMNVGKAFMEMTSRMMADPGKLVDAQMNLFKGYMELWQQAAQKMMGEEVEDAVPTPRSDKRFKDAAWQENQIFDFIKQSYLLTSKWMTDTVHDVEGLDQHTAEKVDFYTRQFADAMSPSNFVMTNPMVLRETLATNGENLVRGLDHLLEDLERGRGKLAIKMTDLDAFEVGGNVATTPGKVVYQNELMQLIQYAPATEQVHERPLLIAPPWINKFYILDLRAENSFIRWCTEQGLTVFVISWVNPDEKLANKNFEDYMHEGILAALDAIEQAVGVREVTTIGYCLGGTLMAATLAYMAARGDDRIKATTFFTAQVDFTEPGELGVFIDDESIAHIEEMMEERGYLEGAEMASTFNMLRANDLIWSFVVNNYLMGKDPFPFDLLYWNSDATRLPRVMHSFYLRKMYQQNLLAQPGGLEFNGTPIDLGKVKIPVYVQAGKEDHIAPYRSVFKATQHFSGPVRFMLAGSGHIAGVVNPPDAKKYQYWTNEKRKKYATPDEWLADATETPGSWWPDWIKWMQKHSGKKVPARVPGEGGLKAIEDAPGSYVKVRSGG
ncbi:MAG: class I poly(R)-hydroxyalkanoic acid synthase [Rhizobiales bacterium NRL2]|jgi:polyhydroxyalkanoate synthase|nr:MAG: class I poly(R)-hydroxyalkanoic acid synthase [Rhizobiales bacterium NRL2]